MSDNHIVKVKYSDKGFYQTRYIFQYDYGMVLQMENFKD